MRNMTREEYQLYSGVANMTDGHVPQIAHLPNQDGSERVVIVDGNGDEGGTNLVEVILLNQQGEMTAIWSREVDLPDVARALGDAIVASPVLTALLPLKWVGP